MAITIGTPQIATPAAFSTATLTVAGNSAGQDSGSTGNSITITANRQAIPPVVQVSDEGSIESPFIDISRQNAENQSVAAAQITDSQTVDNTPRQIRELDNEQQNIQSRAELLEDEEQAIEREINELRRKELEINRRRFELQRQSSLGQFINLEI